MCSKRLSQGLVVVLTICLFQLALTQSASSEGYPTFEIHGTVGLAQAEENSCIAVWVPVDEDMAISGVKWYNNDGNISFPEMLVQSGTPDYPVSLTDGFPVAEGVFGGSLSWSEVSFSEPVACSSDGLYVIFRVPAGAIASAEGVGGGPAIGYTSAEFGFPGWMSEDGQDWTQVHPDFGFAVDPVFVERTADMVSKKGAGERDEYGEATATMMGSAFPNPFNPQTTIGFSLRESTQVNLAVYNLKGELVKQLLAENMASGLHSVVWNGRDHGNASVASGVYFARFSAGDVVMTQRLVLVQ